MAWGRSPGNLGAKPRAMRGEAIAGEEKEVGCRRTLSYEQGRGHPRSRKSLRKLARHDDLGGHPRVEGMTSASIRDVRARRRARRSRCCQSNFGSRSRRRRSCSGKAPGTRRGCLCRSPSKTAGSRRSGSLPCSGCRSRGTRSRRWTSVRGRREASVSASARPTHPRPTPHRTVRPRPLPPRARPKASKAARRPRRSDRRATRRA